MPELEPNEIQAETDKIRNLFFALLCASVEKGSVEVPHPNFDVVACPDSAQPLVDALASQGWTMFSLGSRNANLDAAIPSSMFFILPTAAYVNVLKTARRDAVNSLREILEAASTVNVAAAAAEG